MEDHLELTDEGRGDEARSLNRKRQNHGGTESCRDRPGWAFADDSVPPWFCLLPAGPRWRLTGFNAGTFIRLLHSPTLHSEWQRGRRSVLRSCGWPPDRHPTQDRGRAFSPSPPAAGGEGRAEETRRVRARRQKRVEIQAGELSLVASQ